MAVRGKPVGTPQLGIKERTILAIPSELESLSLLAKPRILLDFQLSAFVRELDLLDTALVAPAFEARTEKRLQDLAREAGADHAGPNA